MLKPAIERFLSKISISDSGCWEWTACLVGRYGYFWNKKLGYSHRFIYEYYHGDISSVLELDHLCRNRKCVNPLHLEQVTHKTNMGRGMRAQSTHCKRGHEFTPENTYPKPTGRECRTCKRIKSAGYHKHNRERLKVKMHQYFLKNK